MMMIWHQCKTDRRPILHFGTFQMTTSAVPAKHGGVNEEIMGETYTLDWPQSKILLLLIIIVIIIWHLKYTQYWLTNRGCWRIVRRTHTSIDKKLTNIQSTQAGVAESHNKSECALLCRTTDGGRCGQTTDSITEAPRRVGGCDCAKSHGATNAAAL